MAASLGAVGTPGSSTANVTLTLPAHAAGDIVVVAAENSESGGIAAPAGGWTAMSGSPRAQGSNVTCVNVWWKRASATNGIANPVLVDPGNHIIAVAYVVQDAVKFGDPVDTTAGSGANSATLTIAGVTPSATNELVAVHVGGQTDTLVDQFSSVTAAGLTSFAQAEQEFTDSGNGGGIAVYTGSRAAASATGNITGTNATTAAYSAIVAAYLNDLGSLYAGPSVRAVGTPNNGTTGSVTYVLPTHASGDILFLVAETALNAGLTAPSGWAHVTGSPFAAGTNISSLNVFWKRATSSSETDPVVPGAADHQVGFAVSVQGAVGTGDPWDFTPTTGGVQSVTSFSLAGGTSTVNDALVLSFLSNGNDTASDQFVNVENNTLERFVEIDQAFSTSGNGGGVALYAGEKTVAGATGTLSGTMPSATWASIILAVKPASGVTNYNGDASLPETVTLASDGVVGKVGAAALAVTVGLVAAGVVGSSTGGSLSETVTLSSGGVVGKVTGGTLAETVTLSSTGVVGASTGGTLACTVTLAATGTVTSGLTSGSSLAETVTLSSTGVVGKANGGSLATTVTLAATGLVNKSTGSSLAETVTLTSSGVVGKSSAATTPITVGLTAAGTVAKSTGAARTVTVTLTATGVVATAGGSVAYQAQVNPDPWQVTVQSDPFKAALVVDPWLAELEPDPYRASVEPDPWRASV